MKKLVFAAVVAFAAAPHVATAQAVDPFPATAPGVCLLSPVVFSVAPTKCFGFFDGNSGVAGMSNGQAVSAATNTNAFNALVSFGFSPAGSYSVIERIGTWNGTDNFATTLTGWAVIGFHWGNYPDSPNNIGNVSAWYLFNFTSPTTDLNMLDTQGISNATVVFNNAVCTANGCTSGGFSTVPEPSTYALMTAGLLAIFGAARRRRGAKA